MRELLVMENFSEASLQKLRETAGLAFHVTTLPPEGDPLLHYPALRTAEVIIGEPTLDELWLAPRLKWLQLTWAGADRYTKSDCFPKNVTLTNATGAFGLTISEHVLAMLLSLCRHLPEYRYYQMRGVHRMAAPERLLSGGTAVILGVGDLGSSVARRLKAFDMHTVGVCRTRRPLPPVFDEVRALPEADSILSAADVIVCCLPDSPGTRKYFDEDRLSSLRKDAIFINVGRGSLVDSDALARLMARGHLYGAGLDVTDPEPLPKDHPLRHLSNVILTPHVAGVGFGGAAETERKITAICCDNIRRYLNGRPLRNQVDFATGYRRW